MDVVASMCHSHDLCFSCCHVCLIIWGQVWGWTGGGHGCYSQPSLVSLKAFKPNLQPSLEFQNLSNSSLSESSAADRSSEVATERVGGGLDWTWQYSLDAGFRSAQFEMPLASNTLHLILSFVQHKRRTLSMYTNII